MSDASCSRKTAETMFSSRYLYLGIFVQIRQAGVLDTVIQADNDLPRIVNPRGSHRPELV
jgi:hypothetical protein